MSLQSECLLLSIVVSLSRERKTTSGMACVREIWKTWQFFQYVMNLPFLGWFSLWTLDLPLSTTTRLPPSTPSGWMITRCLTIWYISMKWSINLCSSCSWAHLSLGSVFTTRSKKMAWSMLMWKLQTSDGAEWQDDCDFTRLHRAKHVPSWVQSSALECASWMSHNVER